MRWLDFLFPTKLGEAEIRFVNPNNGKIVLVKFILRTYKLSKKNDFSETKIPGLNASPLQFVSGESQILSLVLHFDGRKSRTDVRELMKNVSDLMNIDSQLHAPPVVSFQWKGFVLKCVLESMAEEFSSLFPDGRPSVGKMHATFKEFEAVEQLIEEVERD
jgi:hypothetical protein